MSHDMSDCPSSIPHPTVPAGHPTITGPDCSCGDSDHSSPYLDRKSLPLCPEAVGTKNENVAISLTSVVFPIATDRNQTQKHQALGLP